MTKLIPLSRTGKKNAGKHFAIVDDCDFELANSYNWQYLLTRRNKEYAFNSIGKKTIYLHRLLMDAPAHIQVDHIDGNGLLCTRNNMRLATSAQNAANKKKRSESNNSSEYKGVYYNKKRNNYQSYITVNYKQSYLGQFNTPEAAARAYDAAALEHFGEFARLNFPQTEAV